jgi:hypothetical protein
MAFKSYRAESRANYGRTLEDSDNMPEDGLKIGALLRIADSIEVMARNYGQLIDERDRYKRWYEQERASGQRMARSINSLRGVITRMKKAKA